MRLFIFLCLISTLSARTLKEALVSTPVEKAPTLSEAIVSLQPTTKPFSADYGDGILTTQLEKMTMALLSYKWLSNVFSTFTDELQEQNNQKVQFFLNVQKRNLRVVYQF
jgi:hypothetical protein